jgi:hypothetical protein
MFKSYAPYEFTLQMSAAMCWGLSVCSLLFAYAYTQDITAILASPAQIWAFVCGVPLQSNATVPILIGVGICAAGLGSILLVIRKRALTE